MFNVLLIVGVLIALYYCIQKHKNEQNIKSKSTNINNNKEEKIINIGEVIENFNMDKIKYDHPIEQKKVEFDYALRPIEKEFMKEQKDGTHLATWYPNRWIESFDTDGKPVFNSRENVTGIIETFIEPKARFTYNFNKEKTLNMDGIADPDDFIDGKGKSLKDIYDNSFVDFKKLVKQEKLISSEPNTNFMQAASSLFYLTPDTWVYENEKLENGGHNDDGVFAADPDSFGSVAMF